MKIRITAIREGDAFKPDEKEIIGKIGHVPIRYITSWSLSKPQLKHISGWYSLRKLAFEETIPLSDGSKIFAGQEINFVFVKFDEVIE